jgi:hypothetical protein
VSGEVTKAIRTQLRANSDERMARYFGRLLPQVAQRQEAADAEAIAEARAEKARAEADQARVEADAAQARAGRA